MRLRTNRRRGVILLVVLIMLTLFAIAGLTFVLYAEAAAESARFNKDSESFAVSNAPDMDPTQSLDLFLGQLVYGVADPTAANPNNGSSALRGHSLAETLYGSFDSINGSVPSDLPFNGAGRLSEPGLYSGTDGNQLVNYMYFQSNVAGYDPTFLRDPSRPGSRNSASAGRTTYTGGQNPPYTYPDLNSMRPASIQMVNGQPQVAVPSYLRPSLFGSGAATNPHWTDAQGKYMTLRPRPQEMGQTFPLPDPTTGCDVKNLSGLPGGPDSIWIDVNAPELYTASGLRYKMMVAPLILDLDRAINLNVVGNVFAENGPTNRHAGNQGWGQWEVNMSRVLDADNTEWQNTFLGNAGVSGRYGLGAGSLPANVFPLSGNPPHVYAQGDLNGVIDSGNPGAFTTGATQQWAMPSGMSCFPSFPATTYDNGGAGATLNSAGQSAHPMFFNPMNPNSPNRLLPLTSHASLLYAGSAASQNLDLFKLCPTNFKATDLNALRRIYQTTLLSMELDRPGAAPYLFDPDNSLGASTGYTISYNPNYAASFPSGYTYTASAGTFPPFSGPGNLRNSTPADSDFDPRTWRSALPAMLSRMDLDRSLATYASTGGTQPPDRKQFAQDIFTRLVAVTGLTGANANLTSNPAAVTTPQYDTLRFLAQLSANIVDYIDADDVMTVFQWTTAPKAPDTTGIVFGTELPKLVVNEAYLEYDNDPSDPHTIPNPNVPPVPPMIKAANQPYQMNVWVELVNPLPSAADANAPPGGIQVNNDAKLVNGSGTALYQLVITKHNLGLRNPDNTIGSPDGPTPPNAPYATQPYAPTGDSSQAGQVLAVVNSWGTVQSVTPMGTTASIPPPPPPPGATSQGYLVVGPQNPAAPLTGAQQVQLQTSVTANNMTYKVANDANGDTPTPPTILLQRLANPNVAFDAVNNPYVTVDYIDASLIAKPTAAGPYGVVNDARPYNSKGQNPNFVTDPNKRFSYGRMEPYAAGANQVNTNPTNAAGNQWQQQVGAPANANLPTTTFFAVNNPAPPPASAGGVSANHWLVHLDRPLISPIELLNVSGFKPHELTQQFIDVNNHPYSHVAPWTDQSGSSRLYRLLEFVKVNNPTPGLVNGGRIPGRVNVNTIDANATNPLKTEVFEALCDAEPGNLFYGGVGTPDAVVDPIFNNSTGNPCLVNQRPFHGMAQGVYSGTDAQFPGVGLAQTLLGSAANNAGGTNPYQQLELLNKLYSNSTTRSNVFAVWLTVGFFQITDDQTQPMKLGPEINAAQGKAIRHHMFAIIDRTQIQTWKQGTLVTNVAVGPGSTSIGVPTITVTDPRTNVTWTIQPAVAPVPPGTPGVPGTTLVYDPGSANEETVVVQPGYVATFQYSHNKGATVISRGNPGPWSLPGTLPYDVTQDGQVVPYWVIID